MNDVVDIRDLMSDMRQWQIIDVRSPVEYSTGHIPGAVNVPLFTDAERAIVGTLYKQTGPEVAMEEGLKIAGNKMNYYLEIARPFIGDETKKTLIHCWRGGKRSEAIQWLFNFSGIKASRLIGGYKSYRQSLHSFFSENIFDFRILGGYTGSGKTEIIKELAKLGQQVVDLEKLAHHKGSAFGSIGEATQPTNEQFENNLYSVFSTLDLSQPIWLENESRNIGKVFLPETLWWKMRSSILYNIDVEEEVRLKRAIEYYSTPAEKEDLKLSFQKIKKRLGGLEFQNAIKALDENDLLTAASIALKYYDKSYTFQLQNWKEEKVVHLTRCNSTKETTERLISKI